MDATGSWEEDLLTPTARRVVGERAGLVRRIFLRTTPRQDPDVHVTGGLTANIEGIVEHDDVTMNVGGTDRDLQASCMATAGEAVERYGWFRTEGISTRTASYAELREADVEVVDERYLDVFPDDPDETSGELRPFDPDLELDWLAGTDLVTGDEILVPHQLVQARTTDDPPLWPSTTNGAACADSIETGLVRSLEEVIERDAFLYGWYTRQSPPHLSLEGHPELRSIVDAEFAKPGIDVRLLELPAPVDVPAIGCALVQDDGFPKFVIGGGASASVGEAVLDACEEAAMIRQSMYRRFVRAYDSPADITPAELHENVAYYSVPDHYAEISEFFEASEPTVDSVTTDVDRTLESYVDAFATAGLTPIAFDITPEEIRELGWYVTKVFVPELLGLTPPDRCPVDHPRFDGQDVTEIPHPYP